MATIELLTVSATSMRRLRPLHIRWVLVMIWTSLFILHSLFYLLIIPPWQAPDEPTSFELLLTMQKNGRLVSVSDKDPLIERAIIDSMVRTQYWEKGGYSRLALGQEATFQLIYAGSSTQLHRPPLYHLLLLPVANLVRGSLPEQQLLMLRAVTLVFGALTMIVVTLVAYELGTVHPTFPLIMPALVALLPQFAYSSATFNSDNLAILLSALVCYTLLHVLQRGVSIKRLVLLSALLGLGFFTKRTTLFTLPSVIAVVLLQAPALRRDIRWGAHVSWFGGLLAAGLLLFVTPALRNDMLRLVDRMVFETNSQSYLTSMRSRIMLSPAPLGTWLATSIPFLNGSFWGSFGWHTVAIPRTVQNVLLVVTLITWSNAILLLRRLRWPIPTWARQYSWIGLFACLTTILIVFVTTPLPTLPQGRYLFVVVVPITMLITFGLSSWWPRRWIAIGVPLVWLGLAALDMYTIIGVVIPGFYR